MSCLSGSRCRYPELVNEPVSTVSKAAQPQSSVFKATITNGRIDLPYFLELKENPAEDRVRMKT